jgi:hypothetical protein
MAEGKTPALKHVVRLERSENRDVNGTIPGALEQVQVKAGQLRRTRIALRSIRATIIGIQSDFHLVESIARHARA